MDYFKPNYLFLFFFLDEKELMPEVRQKAWRINVQGKKSRLSGLPAWLGWKNLEIQRLTSLPALNRN
jgi:hypothetical protein